MAVYAAESERLFLQSLDVETHLQDYFAIMASPEAMFWSTHAAHTDPEQTRRLMLDSLPTPEKPWNRRWAILVKPVGVVGGGGEYVVGGEAVTVTGNGSSGDSNSDPHSKVEKVKKKKGVKHKMIGIVGMPREGELAYKIHPDHWGKGYMAETMRMFLGMLWESEEYNYLTRLEAAADPENRASTRVLERAGFQKGEYRKEFYVRAVNDVAGKTAKKSDLQFFSLERPASEVITQ